MVSANYYIPVSKGNRVMLSGIANYQDNAQTDVFNGVNTTMQSRTLVNLAVSYLDGESRYSVTAYVANVFDETYRIAALPVAGLWNFTNYGPPRSYGVRVNLKF
jgi:iron complex outermembrane receptor protein